MYDINVDGYKMIYFLENILREYIHQYSDEFSLNSATREKLDKYASDNGVILPTDYHTKLKFSHLGDLVDIIRSKKFIESKNNELKKVNISVLVKHRNSIMHSRTITFEEVNEIKTICEKVIISIEEDSHKSKWDNFITNDISNFEIARLYIEYPVGKNFEKLIGRNDELRELKEFIKAPTPVSVIGHGGLGKTALVLQLIEDLVNSPEQPFENIFFMSFKNSVFEKGEVRRFEKVISNHRDLILKLATFMNIETEYVPIENIETNVWDEIFSKKTLLILDNLETEIVRSNLSEFTGIAQKFIKQFNKPSRLIITSRYGIGDRENKFPLYQFDLVKTRELMLRYMGGQALKSRKLSIEDWSWVQRYTQGNPGLIIALCHTFSSTRKQVIDIRMEYESEYTKESTELHNQMDEFLRFCFENTIESMSKEGQIFLSCLCYICSEAHITEVNEELLVFLREELNLQKLGDYNTRATNFINIGFLQPITNSDRYYANELVIDYMNGNFGNSENVFNVFKLRESEWFKDIEKLKALINEIQFNHEVSLGTLISELYLSNYRLKNDPKFLLKSFYCNPTLESLLLFYKKSDEIQIINHFNLLDKVPSLLKDNREYNRQHSIVNEFISALLKVNQRILRREITHFRQYELFAFFNQLKEKVAVLRDKKIDISLRKQICKLLIALKKFDLAEEYITIDEKMVEDKFDISVKQVMELAVTNPDRCAKYIEECRAIITSYPNKISSLQQAQFLIYGARFYMKTDPSIVLTLLDNYEKLPVNDNVSIFCLYLESLLIRAKVIITTSGRTDSARTFVERCKKLSRSPTYSKIFPQKQESLKTDLKAVERLLALSEKKVQ